MHIRSGARFHAPCQTHGPAEVYSLRKWHLTMTLLIHKTYIVLIPNQYYVMEHGQIKGLSDFLGACFFLL